MNSELEDDQEVLFVFKVLTVAVKREEETIER